VVAKLMPCGGEGSDAKGKVVGTHVGPNGAQNARARVRAREEIMTTGSGSSEDTSPMENRQTSSRSTCR
jgi:hypothetical protein